MKLSKEENTTTFNVYNKSPKRVWVPRPTFFRASYI